MIYYLSISYIHASDAEILTCNYDLKPLLAEMYTICGIAAVD